MPDRLHFFDLDRSQLEAMLSDRGLPRYRAEQLLRWVYQRQVVDVDQMSDWSQSNRQLLREHLQFCDLGLSAHQSASDGTQKLLLHVGGDGPDAGLLPQASSGGERTTECVMIPASNPDDTMRRTACISSQVGCPVGCRFCASGLGGLETNLTAGQIVEQVWHLQRAATAPGTPGAPGGGEAGGRISNVVFMGMGEPLANFEQVTRAIRTLNADWGMGISGRKITVSTVGLPTPIRRLAELRIPITLAISLHAPNDALRRELIPWAQRISIAELIDAARHYFAQTKREVTLEYILLREVNDRPEHARELAGLTERLRCNVNLIRYNEVKGLPYNRPTSDDVQRFQHVLRKAGVNAHIRASRGRDIAAACGQLRHERPG